MADENPFMIGEDDQPEEYGAPKGEILVEGADSVHTKDLMTDGATAEPVAEGIDGLIPLCVKHVTGPQKMNSAIYGYDISEMESKPWAKAGANPADYFNYGFNENSWRAFCAMQSGGVNSLSKRAEDLLASIAEKMAKEGGPGREREQLSWGGRAGRDRGDRDDDQGRERYPPRERNALYKTRLCVGFQQGTCTRGENCNFAHGSHELRGHQAGMMPPPPDMGGGHFPLPQPPILSPMGFGDGSMPPPPPQFHSGGGGFRMPVKRERSPEGGEGLFERPQ